MNHAWSMIFARTPNKPMYVHRMTLVWCQWPLECPAFIVIHAGEAQGWSLTRNNYYLFAILYPLAPIVVRMENYGRKNILVLREYKCCDCRYVYVD